MIKFSCLSKYCTVGKKNRCIISIVDSKLLLGQETRKNIFSCRVLKLYVGQDTTLLHDLKTVYIGSTELVGNTPDEIGFVCDVYGIVIPKEIW